VDEQRQLILDQFSRQAVPFSEMHARDGAVVHGLLFHTAGITPGDEVLDVACGPGLVACVAAKVVLAVGVAEVAPGPGFEHRAT
jgi:ubiquinone/menaquinone biosynthesis C-methylase UbiE